MAHSSTLELYHPNLSRPPPARKSRSLSGAADELSLLSLGHHRELVSVGGVGELIGISQPPPPPPPPSTFPSHAYQKSSDGPGGGSGGGGGGGGGGFSGSGGGGGGGGGGGHTSGGFSSGGHTSGGFSGGGFSGGGLGFSGGGSVATSAAAADPSVDSLADMLGAAAVTHTPYSAAERTLEAATARAQKLSSADDTAACITVLVSASRELRTWASPLRGARIMATAEATASAATSLRDQLHRYR